MNKRLMSSIIFMAILILIMIINKPVLDTIVITSLSILGIYEFNKAFKGIGYNLIGWVGYLSCSLIFTMGGLMDDTSKILLIKIGLPAMLIAIFIYVIVTNMKRNVIDVALTLLSLIYIPFMLSFLKLILMMDNGRLLIWFVFMGAFASDTFGYAIGTKFGKHKLCPDISPKKTVEGSIGGIIGVILSYIIITLIANSSYFGMNLNMLSVLLAGVIVGIAGQFGDLSASAIKRFCKIKDFSNIMPGHGGILDRFDSILFAAPVVYMFLKLYVFM